MDLNEICARGIVCGDGSPTCIFLGGGGAGREFLAQIEAASLPLHAWLDRDSLWEEYVGTAQGGASGADIEA